MLIMSKQGAKDLTDMRLAKNADPHSITQCAHDALAARSTKEALEDLLADCDNTPGMITAPWVRRKIKEILRTL